MRKHILMSILVGASLTATAAAAGGPADKVTGEFTQGNCWGCAPGDELGFVAHRLVPAHEAFGNRLQKGFLLSWRDDGAWFEMDFDDTSETCIHVFTDGQARIGGLVTDGQRSDGSPAPQIGRYFGMLMIDGGEPGYFVDHGIVYRFTTDYWSEAARQQFFDWCDSGVLPAGDDLLPGAAEWRNVVFEGNLQVHNRPADGD